MYILIYIVYAWKFWRAAAIFIYDFTDVDLVYFQDISKTMSNMYVTVISVQTTRT